MLDGTAPPGATGRNIAAHLQIHLLGDLQLWRGGQIVPSDAWSSRKACQLFKLLVTHRHRTVSSDELIEWLWPDLNPESARNSLWVAVSHLRRVLEPGKIGRGASTFILTEPPGYRFDPAEHCQIDVDTFLDRVRAGQAYQRRDEWTVAIDAYLAAQTFETLNWRAMLAGTLLRLGLALQLAGDGVGATAALERVLALSRETHEVYESTYALAALGELRLAQGEREAGVQALAEATALAPQIGLPWHRGGTLLHIAAGRLLLGQVEAAVAAAEEAIRLAEQEDLRGCGRTGCGCARKPQARPDRFWKPVRSLAGRTSRKQVRNKFKISWVW
jgi:tetratricopeptide (TPR) repeat protein